MKERIIKVGPIGDTDTAFSKWIRIGVVAWIFVLAMASKSGAYTVVQVSTSTTEGTEINLLNQMQLQFNVSITSNPFFENTYNVTLFGMNPNYNPPIQNTDLLNALVTVDSFTYVFGWSNGESMERYNDVLYISSFTTWCSSAPFFNMPIISTGPPPIYMQISSTTCNAVLDTMGNFIYTQFFSTPTQVPGF